MVLHCQSKCVNRKTNVLAGSYQTIHSTLQTSNIPSGTFEIRLVLNSFNRVKLGQLFQSRNENYSRVTIDYYWRHHWEELNKDKLQEIQRHIKAFQGQGLRKSIPVHSTNRKVNSDHYRLPGIELLTIKNWMFWIKHAYRSTFQINMVWTYASRTKPSGSLDVLLGN